MTDSSDTPTTEPHAVIPTLQQDSPPPSESSPKMLQETVIRYQRDANVLSSGLENTWKYWQRKRVIHGISGNVLLMLTMAYGFFSASFLKDLFFTIWNQFSGVDGYPPYYVYLPFLVSGSFLLWMMRVLVRVTYNQMYLWGDAAERVVAIRTYLSLVTHETPFGDDLHKTVLRIIFKSTSPIWRDLTPQPPTSEVVGLAERVAKK